MSDKPKKGEDETSLDYGLRVAAWKRAERKRKREMGGSTPKAEAAEPEEKDLRDRVSDAWTRSERELEKMGE